MSPKCRNLYRRAELAPSAKQAMAQEVSMQKRLPPQESCVQSVAHVWVQMQTKAFSHNRGNTDWILSDIKESLLILLGKMKSVKLCKKMCLFFRNLYLSIRSEMFFKFSR